MNFFKEGERVILINEKGRKFIFKLRKGATYHTNSGTIAHDELFNLYPGQQVKTNKEIEFYAFRPTLAENIVSMSRAAQIIYPKDLAQMLFLGDIKPGDRVLEAGVGSGALSSALIRYGVKLVGYELREDHLEVAKNNLARFIGSGEVELYNDDVSNELREKFFDVIILDLPEPWNFEHLIQRCLKAGGIFISYLPTVLQVYKLYEQLKGAIDFHVEEILVRDWYLSQSSMRPNHKMIAHTGFIVRTRFKSSPSK